LSFCTFCDIVNEKAPASIVYSDDRVIAFMDIQPVNSGHLLVIPRGHAADLASLDPDMGGHLFRVGMKLAGALRRSGVRCEGVNFFLADGAPAGQEIMHVHLHVLPRFRGDGFGFRFGPDYFDRPPRTELAELAGQIRSVLQD
jgi:histidine triad (HIT) family protein